MRTIYFSIRFHSAVIGQIGMKQIDIFDFGETIDKDRTRFIVVKF